MFHFLKPNIWNNLWFWNKGAKLRGNGETSCTKYCTNVAKIKLHPLTTYLLLFLINLLSAGFPLPINNFPPPNELNFLRSFFFIVSRLDLASVLLDVVIKYLTIWDLSLRSSPKHGTMQDGHWFWVSLLLSVPIFMKTF